MDPSYNNSFGSFGANSGTPGGAPSGVPGGASSVGTSGAGASNGASDNMSANATQGPIVSSGDTTVENFTSSEFPSGGLSIGGERKSRKGVIILLVVLVVLLIGGIAGYIAWKNGLFGGNGESSDSSSNEFVVDENVSMEVAFNRYANYIVSGEVKDDAVKGEAFDETIELDRKYEDEEFVKNASALYGVFYGKASEIPEDSRPEGDISRIKNGFDFMIEIKNVNVMNTDELSGLYLSGGEEKANEYLDGINKQKDEQTNYLSTLFIELQVEYGKSLIEQWNYFKSVGCFVNGGFDENCINNIPLGNYQESAEKLGQNDMKLNSFAYNVVADIRRSTKVLDVVINESGEQR